MVTQATQAGTITRETMIPIQRLLVEAGETITKGDLCNLDSDGFLVKSLVSTGTSPPLKVVSPFFVALETVANIVVDGVGGTDGYLSCPVAVPGHYVTVRVGAAGSIRPGQYVNAAIGTANSGSVIAATNANSTLSRLVGRFIAKEGGTISRGTNSNPETLSDTEEFGSASETLTVGDIIEIYLGVN